jgi:hypothetical protein
MLSYRDIYAFDRTAVRIPNDLNKWSGTGDGGGGKSVGDVEELNDEDSAYLNANVIADGKGRWLHLFRSFGIRTAVRSNA